ncbi:ABC transporter permease [Kallipyga massiliensis]|uniref:ABC transporter permease n=1 Tax=Kallipyga massiliensis TaxID=1472764 RepID=UPI0004B119F2|nr:ABC transporter permease [Kallipyga massiliensis]
MRGYRRLTSPYLLWALIFVLVPLVMTFYYAFSLDGSFSLVNFQRFFTGPALVTLVKSLRVAFLSTLICLALGYPMAYFIAQTSIRFRPMAMTLIIIPMWMNFLLRTYSWMTLLSRKGIISTILVSLGMGPVDLLYTEYAVILGMVYNFLPFMVLPIYTSLSKMDRSLVEAANDLGANRLQTFRRVTFPLSLPGVFSGISMVFIPAISTFEISTLLGGNKTNLIGNVIEQQFTVTGNWNYGFSMAVILMVFLVLSLLFTKEEEEEITKKRSGKGGKS